MSGDCFIVGAGSFDGMSVRPREGDLVIAADGGYTYLKEAGIEPQVLMGDFDSLRVVPEHKHLMRHSPIKDDTDMALAVAYAAELGYRRFFLYGGLGGRLDHTLANVQLLNGMSRAGLEAYLIGETIMITAITQERIVFGPEASGMISVFCLGEAASGIWERGLKYRLDDAVLTCDRTLGVSNEFLGQKSSIEVHSGTLQILWDEKNGLPKERVSLQEKEKSEETAAPRSEPGGQKARDERDASSARQLVSDFGWDAMHRKEGELPQTDKYTGERGTGLPRWKERKE